MRWLSRGGAVAAAAARFGVSETAAINWVKRVEQTGSRTPAQLGGYKPMLLAPHQEFLEAVRRDKPDITLQGLCDRLAAERGVKAYTSVMSRFLRHVGVTLKKRPSSRASKTGRT
jgi:transposase